MGAALDVVHVTPDSRRVGCCCQTASFPCDEASGELTMCEYYNVTPSAVNICRSTSLPEFHNVIFPMNSMCGVAGTLLATVGM